MCLFRSIKSTTISGFIVHYHADVNRMIVEDKSKQTITYYVRVVERLVRFQDLEHPNEMDIDEVLGFLVCLTDKRGVN